MRAQQIVSLIAFALLALAETMAPEGVAVGAAMIPVLVGGVLGAGIGTMLLYGGEFVPGSSSDSK